MVSWWALLFALCLDLVLGDPPWFPHPVRLIGRWAGMIEGACRRCFGASRRAGFVAWLCVTIPTSLVAGTLWWAAGRVSQSLADVVAAILIYFCLAARDLSDHSRRVHAALARGDLPEARRRVAMIVGRDTENLDESEISRAAVETVAESTVDGITAPLFWAVVAGPVGSFAYKAINTLDSMWGHKDPHYERFGWAAARLDDLANLIPARLTAPLIAASAALLRLDPVEALRCWWRDGHLHLSPNSGIPEAAFAGALGIQLGGVNTYGGEVIERARVGSAHERIGAIHILRANALMLSTSVVAAALLVGSRELILRICL